MASTAAARAESAKDKAVKTEVVALQLRRSACSLEEDLSMYAVNSRTERCAILRGMREQGSLVTFYFDNGYDFLLTSVLDISADNRTMVLDYGSSMEMNRKALQTAEISCVSSKEQIKIKFSLHGVGQVKHDGRDAFLSEVPDDLIRIQRREHFRMATSMTTPILATVPLPLDIVETRARQAVVVDISGGGVGLNVAADFPCLKLGAQFFGVSINLPKVGMVSVDMVVRSFYDVVMPSGAIHRRAGCQFIKANAATMMRIQRFIIQIERERKLLGM